jgi:hypothetical protein
VSGRQVSPAPKGLDLVVQHELGSDVSAWQARVERDCLSAGAAESHSFDALFLAGRKRKGKSGKDARGTPTRAAAGG